MLQLATSQVDFFLLGFQIGGATDCAWNLYVTVHCVGKERAAACAKTVRI